MSQSTKSAAKKGPDRQSSCDISDPAGVRDYAILMLLAGLGLQSIEAARLQLDDLDWRAGRIVLRGKASREDGMPLPADVGEALSAYLRQARPATDEPPGVSAAVLGGVAVGVEPGRVRVGEQRQRPAAAIEPDPHPRSSPTVAQLGDKPAQLGGREAAGSPITTSNGYIFRRWLCARSLSCGFGAGFIILVRFDLRKVPAPSMCFVLPGGLRGQQRWDRVRGARPHHWIRLDRPRPPTPARSTWSRTKSARSWAPFVIKPVRGRIGRGSEQHPLARILISIPMWSCLSPRARIAVPKRLSDAGLGGEPVAAHGHWNEHRHQHDRPDESHHQRPHERAVVGQCPHRLDGWRHRLHADQWPKPVREQPDWSGTRIGERQQEGHGPPPRA